MEHDAQHAAQHAAQHDARAADRVILWAAAFGRPLTPATTRLLVPIFLLLGIVDTAVDGWRHSRR